MRDDARIDGRQARLQLAPRRSASMESRVSASAACSISLSATVCPCSVSCARYTSAMPPRPSLWRISYLPSLAAGRRDHCCLLYPPTAPVGGQADTPGYRFCCLSCRRQSPAARSSAVLFETFSDQRRPRPLARRHARALVPPESHCARSRACDGPRISMPSRQAVVDGVGAQHRAAAAADLDPDARALHLHVVDLHVGIVEHDPRRKRHLRIGQNAEAADPRALHASPRSRPARRSPAPRAGSPPAARGCAACTPSFSRTCSSIFAAGHFHGVARHAPPPAPPRYSDVPRRPRTLRFDHHRRRRPEASRRTTRPLPPATVQPAKNSGAAHQRNRRRQASRTSAAGAANCSPSTITTVTLSLPPAAIGRVDQLAHRRLRIAAHAAPPSAGSRADATWSLSPSLHKQQRAVAARRECAAPR